ncbi:hypothetical protein E2P63_03945 [Candidatus Bathyarchaeota archaeon]|nr:hypothetical protein E2P63_03945 [Candidatus Bathyarchaeota archaeon]
MVTETYDHIVAIVLVGVIFIGTVVAVPAAISFTTFQAVDEQQLRNTATNLFNAILLGPGNPSNWGSIFPFDQTNVNEFGLASDNQLSKYILNSDKVQRLDPKGLGYISYSYVKDLLGMQEYDFSFSLFRPFNVDWDIQFSGQNTVQLSVNVTRTEDGAPIPGAAVNANIVVTAVNPNKKDQPTIAISEIYHTEYTNLMGSAKITETMVIDSGYSLEKAIAFMRIVVSGMETMVVASKDILAQDCLRISTFDDTVGLTFWDQEYYNTTKTPNGERKIEYIYGYDFESLMLLHKGDSHDVVTQGDGYDSWSRTFPGISSVNPPMLIFVISVPLGQGQGGRQLVVIGGPFSFNAQNKIFTFGHEGPYSNVIATLQRFVVIDGMTYIAKLNLQEALV